MSEITNDLFLAIVALKHTFFDQVEGKGFDLINACIFWEMSLIVRATGFSSCRSKTAKKSASSKEIGEVHSIFIINHNSRHLNPFNLKGIY
jgi:hypothetical protein